MFHGGTKMYQSTSHLSLDFQFRYKPCKSFLLRMLHRCSHLLKSIQSSLFSSCFYLLITFATRFGHSHTCGAVHIAHIMLEILVSAIASLNTCDPWMLPNILLLETLVTLLFRHAILKDHLVTYSSSKHIACREDWNTDYDAAVAYGNEPPDTASITDKVVAARDVCNYTHLRITQPADVFRNSAFILFILLLLANCTVLRGSITRYGAEI